MFLGTISNYTSVANADIPIATVINSNNKISNNSTEIDFNKAGFYNVDAVLNITGPAADITLNLVADGAVKRSVTVTVATADDYVVIPLMDALKVLQSLSGAASISLQLDTAGYTVNGTVRVEYVQ